MIFIMFLLVMLKICAWLFWWRKVCASLWKLTTLFKSGIEGTKIRPSVRIQSITMIKTIGRI